MKFPLGKYILFIGSISSILVGGTYLSFASSFQSTGEKSLSGAKPSRVKLSDLQAVLPKDFENSRTNAFAGEEGGPRGRSPASLERSKVFFGAFCISNNGHKIEYGHPEYEDCINSERQGALGPYDRSSKGLFFLFRP